METVLAELAGIPGVIGLYAINSEEGVVSCNMPPLFTDNELVDISKVLIKVHTTGAKNIADLVETTINYEESVFVVRAAANNFFLIVMFEPSMTLDLLTMSLNMAMSDLKRIVGEQQEPDEEAEEERVNDTQPETPDKISRMSAEELLANGSGQLSETLNRMQNDLKKVMGPIAKIVFIDSLYKWLNDDQPSMANLPLLIGYLCDELNDPEKAESYREIISRKKSS